MVAKDTETDMKKRYKVNRIVSARMYDFKMISKCLGVNKRTIQIWHKQGKLIVDSSSRPYLVRGADLIAFLLEMQKQRKCPLTAGQFYCLKCQTGRLADPDSIFYEETHHKLGKSAEQIIIHGKCEMCGTPVSRLSSTSDVSVSEDKTVTERLMYNRTMPSKHRLPETATNIRKNDKTGVKK